MSVDRGGLQYSINVDGNHRQELKAFRDELKKAREEGNRLRSTRSTSSAARADAKAQKEATKNSLLRAQAIRELNRETRRQAVNRTKANISEQQGFVVQRRARIETELRAKAEERLSRFLEREQEIIERSNAMYARGVKVTENLAVAMGTASKARIKQTKETQKLTAAEKALQRVQERRALVMQKAEAFQRAGILKDLTEPELIREGLASRSRSLRAAGPSITRTEAASEKKTMLDRIRNFRDLTQEMGKSGDMANRISFTFRRLFGILAAFTAVRVLIQSLRDLTRTVIEYNAALEQAELGIASVIAATGDIRDAQGDSIRGAQAFAVAQQEARKQTDLLRVDALRTAATFDQLLDTFQVALAPGLRAGLNIDEIRNFSIRISQAASAIGLAQNQLAEEIRSILAGTIQLRTTRIAAALGITNEDIRRAKEAGELVEFLNTRFEAFKLSGEEAMKTFSAILPNLKNAFLLVFQQGSLDAFERLKNDLLDIFNIITEQDPVTGLLEPSPYAVEAVRNISDVMLALMDEIRNVGTNLGLTDLRSFSQDVKNTLVPAISVFGGIIEGAAEGLVNVRNIVVEVIRTIERVTGLEIFDEESLENTRGLVKAITEALVTLLASLVLMKTAAAAVLIPLTTMKGLWVGIRTIFSAVLGLFVLFYRTAQKLKKIGTAIGGVVARVFTYLRTSSSLIAGIVRTVASIAIRAASLVGIAALVLESVRKVFNLVTGMNLKIITVGKIIRLSFNNAWEAVKYRTIQVWGEIRRAVVVAIEAMVSTTLDAFMSIPRQVLKALAHVSDTAKDALEEFERTQKGLTTTIRMGFEETKRSLDQSINDAKKSLRDANAEFENGVRQALEDNADAPTLMEGLRSAGRVLFDTFIRGINTQALAPALDDITGKVEDIEEEAQTVADAFDRITSSIGSALPGLTELSDIAKNFEDNLRDANHQLELTRQTMGLDSGVADARRAILQSLHREQKDLEKLADREETLRHIRDNASRELVANSTKLAALKGRERDAAEAILEVERQRAVAIKDFHELSDGTAETEGRILDSIKEANKQYDEKLNSLIIGRDISQETVDLVMSEVENTRKLNAATKQLLEIDEARAEVRRMNNQLLFRELQAMSEAASFSLRRANEDQAIRVQRQRAELEARNLPTHQRRVALIQAELEEARMLRDTEAERGRIQIEAAEQTIQNLERMGASQDLINQKNAELALLQRNQNLNLAESNLRIQELEMNLGEAREFFRLTIEDFEQWTTDFARLASDSLIDAFDPRKGGNVQEKFANFLLDISKQIAGLIAQAILFRSIFGASAAPGGGLMGLFGMAKGGNVGDAFRSAHGMADGGPVRPSGLSPRDTVPIWADPKEWIIRREAVSQYGHKVMDALNRGLIDPLSIRALAGVRHRAVSRRSAGLGFAEGGPVARAVRTPQTTRTGQETGSGQTHTVLPVLPANDENVERLIRGGVSGFLSVIEDHSSEINRRLGR